MLSTAHAWRRFEAEDALNVLTNDRAKEMTCQHQPMRVQRNVAFLADSRFEPLDDLPADDNGTFMYTGRPT